MKTAFKLYAALLFVYCGHSNAQFTTASFGGNVTDASGSAVAGAGVAIRKFDTGFNQETATDSSGSFLFARLPVGIYELRVTRQGFDTYIQSGIALAVNQTATKNISLKVGQVSEEITVQAGADLVNTRTPDSDQLIDRKRIVELPLNGRSAQNLVFLAAGSTDASNNYGLFGSQGGVYPGTIMANVNGTGPGQVNYQMDGTDHNDAYLNANLPFPNPDAIAEFNLKSGSFTAEYGNASGAIVNVVTRSGTNQVHGTLFEFVRNGYFNARNFFAPSADTLRRNQFGGSAGGAIVKNRLFYFGTYQGTRITSTPAGQVTFVPTVAERAGNFSSLAGKAIVDPITNQPFPGNIIPSNRLSPAAQYILNYIPLPNGAARRLVYSPNPSVQNENQFMPKVDYISGKHQVGGSYFFDNWNQPAIISKTNILADTNTANQVRVQNVSANYTYTRTPTLLFVTTFGYSRQVGGSLSTAPFGPENAGVQIAGPGASPLAAPPELRIGVTGGFAVNTNHLGVFNRGSETIREVVTKVAGAHELRVGGEAVRIYNDLYNTFSMDGQYTFSGQYSGDGVADLLLGKVGTFQQAGGEFKNQVGTKWGFFVQDDWKINSRLTLNLGLRWDPFVGYRETENRVVCWRPGEQSRRYPNAPVGLVFGGSHPDPGCPANGVPNDLALFAPRVGFAYRLTRDDKTSLRGGFGFFHTPIEMTRYLYGSMAPWAPVYVLSGVNLDNPYQSAGIANPFPKSFYITPPPSNATFTTPLQLLDTFPQNYRIPQLISYNLILERQLASNWLLKVGFFGNKGTHIATGELGSRSDVRDVNAAIYTPGTSTVANTQSRRPHSNFTNIYIEDPSNISIYNSLQVTLEKRFSKGFTLLANYTLSKMMDDLGWSNPFNRSFDYGRSANDVPHAFHASEVWELPFKVNGPTRYLVNGWSLNSIINWQSGFPVGILSGKDNSLSGENRDRANYIGGGDPNLGSSRPHGAMVQQFFNTSLFTTNPTGAFGNSGRGIIRLPRNFNTDASLTKNTKLSERVALQFRAETFNLFNNVNFINPQGRGIVNNLTSAQFGQLTVAGDPRIMQFALKLIF